MDDKGGNKVRDLSNVSKTEYALEVFSKENNFIRQIDVYQEFEEAYKNMKYKFRANHGEYLVITYIDYDSNGDEIAHGTMMTEFDI